MEIKRFNFNYSDLDVSVSNIEVIAGYEKEFCPPIFSDYISEVLVQASKLCKIDGVCTIYNAVSFDELNYQTLIKSTVLQTERIVTMQLRKSENIAIFACTIGNGLESYAKEMTKKGDIIKAYFADIAGSVIVEAAMDKIQDILLNEFKQYELKITNRYSPGYCGWNVAEQKHLFKLLPADFNSIVLSDTCLMNPIKSVSGIIGIGKNVKFNAYTCEICFMKNCIYSHKNVKLI
ncbi:MAG: hypothetical protein LLF95_06290 [Bacteroidales bacterium]|nr:hypothetical protein [Bacteroidales bacterium]